MRLLKDTGLILNVIFKWVGRAIIMPTRFPWSFALGENEGVGTSAVCGIARTRTQKMRELGHHRLRPQLELIEDLLALLAVGYFIEQWIEHFLLAGVVMHEQALE